MHNTVVRHSRQLPRSQLLTAVMSTIYTDVHYILLTRSRFKVYD